jgi:hypothetical protein
MKNCEYDSKTGIFICDMTEREFEKRRTVHYLNRCFRITVGIKRQGYVRAIGREY